MFRFCFSMRATEVIFADQRLSALPSGALWWNARVTLVISDLHLGKAQRIARRGGALLPPYDSHETLQRLEQDIQTYNPTTVISLGDSFDDDQAARELGTAQKQHLVRLMAGRHWVWVEGNHDPAPVALGGESVSDFQLGPLSFRHIGGGAGPEISGHWHPKASVSLRQTRLTSACFAMDGTRLVMPAYGAYTGGLSVHHPGLRALFTSPPRVILTRAPGHTIPFDRLCA
jgi:DNA ligase-associated metallophosphoesterase